jgi:Tol biopolymer transport system component
MESEGASPSREAIQAQLSRLLAHEYFARSQALSGFLRYTVEEYLQGRGETLKESLIGLEVLERGSDFDPRIDPIVRVQAGKLRKRLKEYYDTDGRSDPVVIEYPKGGYTPMFHDGPALAAPETTPQPAPPAPASPDPVMATPTAAVKSTRVWQVAAAIAVLAGLPGTAYWFYRQPRPPPVELRDLARVTSDLGSSTFPAISADGKWVAFASDRRSRSLDLWVQPVHGGEPTQLTRHEEADMTPDFSPDGTQVVFRSARDGGGIYVVSVLGGQERRIANGGRAPRFSPDGARIIFQNASDRQSGDLYKIAAGGGEPQRVDIGSSIELGGFPAWTPDGKFLVFPGADLRRNRAWDWWVAPAEGGEPRSTGLAEQLRRQGLSEMNTDAVPGDWADQKSLVFSLPQEGRANLWLASFSPGSWRITGAIRQITFGTARENWPRVSRDGRVVFASESETSHLYELPTKQRRPGSEPLRLTADLGLDPGNFRAATRFSADTRRLVFPSRRTGNLDVFVRDLRTGVESPVTAGSGSEEQPLLSPDGVHVAYSSREGANRRIYLAELGTQTARKVCDDCGDPNSWSGAGRHLIVTNRGVLELLDIESGKKTESLRHTSFAARQATLSPDERILALVVDTSSRTGTRAFLVPFAGEQIPPEQRWVEILKDLEVESLHWSADSASVYFFSTKDNFRCLWQQRFGTNGRPDGDPVATAHFHDNHRSPWSSWLAVTADKLIFSLTEPNVAVWSAQLAPRK